MPTVHIESKPTPSKLSDVIWIRTTNGLTWFRSAHFTPRWVERTAYSTPVLSLCRDFVAEFYHVRWKLIKQNAAEFSSAFSTGESASAHDLSEQCLGDILQVFKRPYYLLYSWSDYNKPNKRICSSAVLFLVRSEKTFCCFRVEPNAERITAVNVVRARIRQLKITNEYLVIYGRRRNVFTI